MKLCIIFILLLEICDVLLIIPWGDTVLASHRNRPVSERVRRADDKRVPFGEGGGDVPDEERLLRFRDADVEVVVPRNEAAVPDGSVETKLRLGIKSHF